MGALTLLKELMLIRQTNQKSAIFITIDFFFDKAFKFQRNVCNGCDDVLMISINVNQIAILNIKGAYYYCVINGINKSDAVNLLQNADLTKKKGVLKR